MKNKFLLAGLIFLFSLSLSAQTYNGSCGDNLKWTLHIGTGILTISGYGYMQEFFYTPTGTYSTPWFSYRESIKTVIIKEGVTSIGNYAFVDCSKLTSVTIPSSVTSIRYGAFSNCDGLKEVHIADITKWCTLSFGSYHANPLYYANNLYVNGSLVTDLIIPNSVTSIGAFAFYGCSSLTSVTIPNGVTSIGHYTFHGCSSLTSVIIPNSVTTIGESAFSGCSSLTSVTIPNGVTSIGRSAFCVCSSLTSVTIPNSVTSIGGYAFSDCSKLTSVTIPNSVTSIGEKAFYNVLNIVYNGTATGTPWGALSINGYVDGFLAYSDASKTTLLACFRAAEGELVIPNSVTSIGGSAFRGCSSLTYVIIPNSVTSIGESAFRGCSSLTSVIIPSSVTSIEENAFYGCKIETIYSFMTGTLCEIKNTTFGLKNTASETILYVPKNAMSVYSKADIWKEFNIVPMTAEQVETNEEVVEVEPTETTADIVWPTITGASTYEMVIRDTDGNDICTLIFNAQGELTQIAYNAPDRNRVPEQTAGQVAGFAFTIIGLDSGTTYDYTIYAKDSDGKVIDTKTGSFTTDGIGVATYLEHSNTNADNKQSVKVIRNGNVYILNGDKTYNLQGMQIK